MPAHHRPGTTRRTWLGATLGAAVRATTRARTNATLASTAAAAWLGSAAAQARARARVVVLGAGWGGLAAAHALVAARDDIDLTLVDRQPQWLSLPLSNPWLVGRGVPELPRVDLDAWAARHGVRFVATEVRAIDRAARTLATTQGPLSYDWLVLAPGTGYDDAAWYGTDTQARAQARAQWPAGFTAAELPALRRGLAQFAGGTLLLTVPPAPYRCPPAPYERALLLAGWMEQRKLPGRIVLLDAGGGMPRLNRLFGRHGAAARIEHRTHSPVRAVNTAARVVATDVDDVRFDHAVLLPPMHAGALVREAGLADDQAPGWAAADPATLQARADERIFIVGDAMGPVSPLFGAYPKTAWVAADQGAVVATQLLARVRGAPAAPAEPPRSECHVWLQSDPQEQIVLEASHRRRADGVLMQAVRQTDNTQPRGEDVLAVRTLMRLRLGIGAAG